MSEKSFEKQQQKQSLNEQIDELKRKLALLSGDRKNFTEHAEGTKKKNHEMIEHLRKQNKELRSHLQDLLQGDVKVLDTAFQGRPLERAGVRNKSGDSAVLDVDLKHSDYMKRLNALRHKTASKQKELEEIQTRYNQLIKDSEEVIKTDAGESDTAAKLRTLENCLDKAELKYNEAITIQRTYHQIKDHLLKESLMYGNRLDALEKQIQKSKEEAANLKVLNKDATMAKENATNEFAKFEDKVYRERKEREICLETKRKEAEQKKHHAERIDRRLAQLTATPAEDLAKEMTEAEREKITSYEEAFMKIYEETGVSTMQDVVERYKEQGEKTQRLEQDKIDALQKIERLKDEKERLIKKFEEMKYSGEQTQTESQKQIEEFNERLKNEEKRRDEAKARLERTNQLLVQVKSDIEHLANKLQSLKATKNQLAATAYTKTNEYILDVFNVTEDKLLKLYSELESQGMYDLQQQMKEDGGYFVTTNVTEAKLPLYNTRIPLAIKGTDRPFEDEDVSGDEGDEDFKANRDQIKQASKQIVESKTKRHIIKKSKK